jgi:hypothetical protein
LAGFHGTSKSVSPDIADLADCDSSALWRLGTLASQFHFEPTILGDFYRVELHGTISRLALAI